MLQAEAVHEVRLRQIVEEYAADAARFLAVFQIKILVAPFFITGVGVIAEGTQRVTTDAVKMHRVAFEAVVRREVHAAAEPPHGFRVLPLLRGRLRREEAHVHVRGRHVGIARMQNE